MHCRSFRDDDILKCLEQFCGLHVQRPCNNESNVAEDSTGLAELACTVMPTFGSLLLSECGVIALFGFILSAQRQFYCMSLIFASIA